ncbi:ATP-binding protein [Haloechinothrix salitolerans]|uniref:ATP-binding protein n=1 Tax=Haloechinothrix salitolerans TaxID=926830 RepID=A0ABW2BX56_9PSEU
MTRIDNLVPLRYRDAQLDETEDPKLDAWIDEIRAAEPTTNIDRPKMHGPSLLILGPTGVGKTHKAYALLRHLVDGGLRLRSWPKMISAADLYARLRPRSGVDSEQVFEEFLAAEMVFIDDLGAAKTSEWVEEVNYRLIDHRYNNQLATIFTSNVPPRELGEVLGERVASRLTEMCTTVVLKGADRRRNAA